MTSLPTIPEGHDGSFEEPLLGSSLEGRGAPSRLASPNIKAKASVLNLEFALSSACQLPVRDSSGVFPVHRRNARWNALGSEKPSMYATSDSDGIVDDKYATAST